MIYFTQTVMQQDHLFSSYEVNIEWANIRQATYEFNQARETYLKALSAFAKEDFMELPRGYDLRFFARFPEKFTRTEETCQFYTKRVRSLYRRYRRKTGKNPIHEQEDFFAWLIVRKQLFTTSTWKLDKFALIYIAKKHKLGSLLGLLLATNNRGGKDSRRKVPAKERLTGAQKQKWVGKKDGLKIFEEYFHYGKGYWAMRGFEFFFTILCTGMRPIELTQCKYMYAKDHHGRRRLAVIAKNAKHTNGRGNGEYRTIFIDHLEKEHQDIIFNAIDHAKASCLASGKPTTPQTFVARVSASFSKVVKKIFPRRFRKIVLYSARHQFAADAKRSGLAHAEVAALLGHASDATAFRHYARSSRGRASSRFPKPQPSEVATVNRVYKPFAAKNLVAAKNTANAKQTLRTVPGKGSR